MKFRRFGFGRLTDADGRDVTPRSAKAVAVLALLMDAAGHHRSRRWLEAMLWSASAPGKASQSLRQVLYVLRDSLPPDTVHTDRKSVWLTGVTPDEHAEAEARAAGQIFLEGIDIDEEGFNDWLAIQRKEDIAPPPTAPAPAMGAPAGRQFLVRADPSSTEADALFLCRAAVDGVSSLLSEFGEAEIFQPPGLPGAQAVSLDGIGLELAVDVLPDAGGGMSVRMALRSPMTGRLFWSHRARSDTRHQVDHPWFQEQVFRAVEACYSASASLPDDGQQQAEALAAKALRGLFRLNKTGQDSAEQLLAQALRLHNSPQYHMWKTMLHQTQAVERTRPNWDETVAAARHHMETALTLEGSGSMLAALSAQSQAMLGADVDLAMDNADLAIKLNAGNAFAYSGLASVALRKSDYAGALTAAETGLRIAGATSLAPWWHQLAGLAAMAQDDTSTALNHFRKAHMHAPGFRAPLRHLCAIYMAQGQLEQAQLYIDRLTGEEPDFTMARLMDDPGYPAVTLRNSSLMPQLRAAVKSTV